MKSSKQILSENLKALLKSRGWSARELSRQTNGDVSDRYIGMILNCEYNASVEVLDQLAKAFRLQGWQLMVPGVPADQGAASHFNMVVTSYLTADEDSRSYIEHVAEREANYPHPKRK